MNIYTLQQMGATGLSLALNYLPAWYGGIRSRRVFQDVETFCIFIGYPRSGHSLMGSLLDAHPRIAIAHQEDVLKYILGRYTRWQIYDRLLENSRRYGQINRQTLSYSYHVPEQWQGKFTTLQTLGDKHGESFTLKVRRWPYLLERLHRVIDAPIKYIHVIRNPYDNIATISKKTTVDGRSLDLTAGAAYYFSLCETVSWIKSQVAPEHLFELRHEAFLEHPRDHLRRLCEFLNVETSDEYMDACAGTVYKSPHRSRYETTWTPELRDAVEKEIEGIPYLSGYRFDE